jgi:hypothetical protein
MKKLLAGICILTLAALAACTTNKQLTSMPLSQIAIDTIVAVTMQAAKNVSPGAPTALNTPALITVSPSAAATPSSPTTSGAPTEPSSISVSNQCLSGNLTATLTWKAVTDNGTGYHVYRNGTLIATLPANATTYTDTAKVTPGTGIVYSVAAFNDTGNLATSAIGFLCK